MKRYWVSFQLDGDMAGFEYHGPWWISGWGGQNTDEPCVCLAICARNESQAKRAVLDSFDELPKIREWRFVNERPGDWVPFCDRFSRREWMVWPITPEEAKRLRGS